MVTSYPGSDLYPLLIKVLKDIEPYNDQVVLVGGWLPFIYHYHLWKSNADRDLMSTTDLDFALRDDYGFKGEVLQKIFDKHNYYKKLKIYDEEDIPFGILAVSGDKEMKIDFISHEHMDPTRMSKLTGGNIEVAPIDHTEILLDKKNTILLKIETSEGPIETRIPVPAAYLFLKGITCSEREMKQRGYKFKKDLWSVYFVLRYVHAEHKAELMKHMGRFSQDKDTFAHFKNNLKEYFATTDSAGPKGIAELTGLPLEKNAVLIVNDFLKQLKLA